MRKKYIVNQYSVNITVKHFQHFQYKTKIILYNVSAIFSYNIPATFHAHEKLSCFAIFRQHFDEILQMADISQL